MTAKVITKGDEIFVKIYDDKGNSNECVKVGSHLEAERMIESLNKKPTAQPAKEEKKDKTNE